MEGNCRVEKRLKAKMTGFKWVRVGTIMTQDYDMVTPDYQKDQKMLFGGRGA